MVIKQHKKTAKIAASLALVLLSGCSSKGSSSTVHEDASKVTSESAVSTEMANTTDTTGKESTEITTVKNLKKPTVPTKIHPIDETNILILSENDYRKEDVLQKTDNALLFKPMISLSEAFPNVKYELFNDSPNFPDGFSPKIYNDGKWYSENYTEGFNTEKDVVECHTEIQCYDVESGKLTTLFESDKAMSVLLCKGKYMIWEEASSYNWINPSWHLYDLETGEDIVYYKAILNESGASYYGWHYNTPVLIDDKIYYDDMIGIQEDGVSHYIIYCYDIKNKTLETVHDDAREPTLYKGKLAWDNLSSDREHAVFCNEEETFFRKEYSFPARLTAAKELLIMNDELSCAFMSSFDNTLPCVEKNKGMNAELAQTFWLCDGVKIIRNNKAEPIIIGDISGESASGNITDIKSDGRFVFWRGSYVGKPSFYDSKTDKIIEVDFLPDALPADLPDNKIITGYNWDIREDNKFVLTCSVKYQDSIWDDDIKNEDYSYMISLNK